MVRLPSLAEELATMLAASLLDREDVADLLGVPDKAIEEWLTGATEPPLRTYRALCRMLGVEFDVAGLRSRVEAASLTTTVPVFLRVHQRGSMSASGF